MTWLYIPASVSATDTPEPNSPSDPWHQYEPFVVLSGTPTQRPSSWNGWNRRAWIHALSGMTYAPSTAQRGVDEWISSLPVSPANHSQPPGNKPGLMMIAGSGRTSHGSFVTWLPDTCCWRTSDSLLPMDYPKSSMTLPRSGSMRNGVCSQRQPLVPLTDVNGSGLWGTPVARDDQKTPEAHLAMKARMGGGRTEATSLTVQSKMWSTPTFMPVAKRWRGPHDPTTATDGSNGSQRADLNPFFVASLMGLPSDWLTHSTSEVTVWCRNALHTPGHNSSNEQD